MDIDDSLYIPDEATVFRTSDANATFNLRQPVGYYKYDDVQFYLCKKPRWLTRLMMRHFFELEWVDE